MGGVRPRHLRVGAAGWHTGARSSGRPSNDLEVTGAEPPRTSAHGVLGRRDAVGRPGAVAGLQHQVAAGEHTDWFA